MAGKLQCSSVYEKKNTFFSSLRWQLLNILETCLKIVQVLTENCCGVKLASIAGYMSTGKTVLGFTVNI